MNLKNCLLPFYTTFFLDSVTIYFVFLPFNVFLRRIQGFFFGENLKYVGKPYHIIKKKLITFKGSRDSSDFK